MDIESGRGVASSAFPSFDVVDAPPAPVRSRRKGPENHAFKEHDFLQQGGGAINSFSLNQQSTIATKYTKGFFRRKVDPTVERVARDNVKSELRSGYNARRREKLGRLDHRNGFNVITGADKISKNPAMNPTKRSFGPMPYSSGLKKEATIRFRESKSRFHNPDDKPNKSRTSQLTNSGFTITARTSSIIGFGRPDVRSYGADDAFNQNLYERRPSTSHENLMGGGWVTDFSTGHADTAVSADAPAWLLSQSAVVLPDGGRQGLATTEGQKLSVGTGGWQTEFEGGMQDTAVSSSSPDWMKQQSAVVIEDDRHSSNQEGSSPTAIGQKLSGQQNAGAAEPLQRPTPRTPERPLSRAEKREARERAEDVAAVRALQ